MARGLVFSLLLAASCGEEPSDGGLAGETTVASSVELPKLKVVGSTIRDPLGRAVFLRGANYSHRSKSKPYLGWQKPDHFSQLRGWGFNCVRYLLMWDAIEPQPGQIDQAYLDHLDQALGWAAANGIYVLLDMHQDLYGPSFGGDGAPAWASSGLPTIALNPWFLTYFTPGVLDSFNKLWSDADLQSHFVTAWKAVVQRAKNHSNVVGYDLFNEPFPGTQWYADFEAGALSQFYAKVAKGIQEVQPDAVFFLEPSAVPANQGIPTSLKPPAGVPVVYAPHFYDPLIMGSDGAVYAGGGFAENGIGVMKSQAAAMGAPLFIGEFGTFRDSPSALAAMRDQCAAMDAALAAGWTYWDFNPDLATNQNLEIDTMSLIDGGKEHPAMDVLVRAYPRAVAGEPVSMSFDPAKGTFSLTIRDPIATAPTLIYLPPRHFPAFTVATTGAWTFDPIASILSVSDSVVVRRK